VHPRARLLALDVVSVLLFVVIGRRQHDEGSTLGGIAKTALPFLIALLVGWAVSRAWKRPFEGPTGLNVWLITVALGLVLRRTVFDRGTATAFVIVATVFLGVTLLGWRFLAWRSLRRRTPSTGQ
jgi:FtsH-binding integral membrane protein